MVSDKKPFESVDRWTTEGGWKMDDKGQLSLTSYKLPVAFSSGELKMAKIHELTPIKDVKCQHKQNVSNLINSFLEINFFTQNKKDPPCEGCNNTLAFMF